MTRKQVRRWDRLKRNHQWLDIVVIKRSGVLARVVSTRVRVTSSDRKQIGRIAYFIQTENNYAYETSPRAIMKYQPKVHK